MNKSYYLNLYFLPDGKYKAILIQDDWNADLVGITKWPSGLKTEEFPENPFLVTSGTIKSENIKK